MGGGGDVIERGTQDLELFVHGSSRTTLHLRLKFPQIVRRSCSYEAVRWLASRRWGSEAVTEEEVDARKGCWTGKL